MFDSNRETSLWLGPKRDEARWVFLLPNQPELPVECDDAFMACPDVPLLIELNGNHWRKIFTIMAKLTVPPEQDWRIHRDKYLFERCAITFDKEALSLLQSNDEPSSLEQRVIFVVGNSFRQDIPIKEGAVLIGEKQQAFFVDNQVWCPYLDYRQFPNALIADLRRSALYKLLENPCYKH